MFDAWKARRQKLSARMEGWHAQGRQVWAGVRRKEAGWKLSWNRRERRMRRAWQRRSHAS